MVVETISTPGLAHRSYLVGDGDEVVVVDPRYEPGRYVEAAVRRGARITTILETHRNEDYVGGSLALAERTGARVLHGRGIPWGYGVEVDDGDEHAVGDLLFRVLRTPGHTPESVSFAVIDRSTGDDPVAVFTGDALFVGAVGRTDLMGDRRGAAELLYDSLHGRILPLGDHVVLYPAHGAGSVCGGGIADRDVSTLGYERRNNPALRLDRAAFVRTRAAEEHVHPPYFERMEAVNLEGTPEPGALRPLEPLRPAEVAACVDSGAVVLDVRDPAAICGALVPGAIGVPLGMVTTWTGWFVPYDQDIVLVCDSAACARAARRHLAFVGYTRVVGWLAGGLLRWADAGRPYAHVPTVSGPAVRRLVDRRGVTILDVRNPAEWREGHLPGATHAFLGDLPDALHTLPRDGRIVTFCTTGRRSTIAATLLLRAGFRDVSVALGSMRACEAVGCPIVTGEPEPV